MNTDNDLEMKREAERKTLHRMAKEHHILEVWQGSQNICATQKESHTQSKQMTAVGYISDTEEIVKACWSNVQPDVAAAFKLSERSPVPPALPVKDIPGGRTQVLKDCRIKRIECHAAENDGVSELETISDTENWLNWNCDLENANDIEDDWEADNESDMELDEAVEDSATPEQRDVSATLNVPGLIWPTWRSKKMAQKMLLMVNTMETRSNKGINKM